MTTDPDQIRQDIERTRSSLSQDVNTLADTVSPAQAARRTTARAGAAFTGAKDKIMGATAQSASGVTSAAGQASSTAGQTMSAAREKVSGARRQIRGQTTGNPLAVGLIAVGVGWLAGSLLPASRAEQQAAAKFKDAAAPAVTEAAKQTAASLKESAQQAAESVKTTAADAAATVKEEAAGSARDVREQAETARSAVTDSR